MFCRLSLKGDYNGNHPVAVSLCSSNAQTQFFVRYNNYLKMVYYSMPSFEVLVFFFSFRIIFLQYSTVSVVMSVKSLIFQYVFFDKSFQCIVSVQPSLPTVRDIVITLNLFIFVAGHEFTIFWNCFFTMFLNTNFVYYVPEHKSSFGYYTLFIKNI